MAQTCLPVCLEDLLLIIACTYAALELMGLLQGVCFMFQGKSAGPSPADRDNTCLNLGLTSEQVFISTGPTWLYTVLSARVNSSSSSEQPGRLGQCVHAAYRWAAGKL